MPDCSQAAVFRHHIPAGERKAAVAHSTLLLDCYARATRGQLVARTGDAAQDAHALFAAPFAVLSHGTQADPLLNYANACALRLWETSRASLLKMPSRLTAEAPAQAAREALLRSVAEKGFVSGYEGVRISATGRRFLIANVTIWNLAFADGTPAGQAATFDRWSNV